MILGEHMPATLRATEAAVQAMREVRGVILPFPNGIVRSGSKPGSRYKGLPASTNDAYCPSLRAVVPKTQIGQTIGCVFEIVIDGLDLAAVEEAMRHGAKAAAEHGAVQISAGPSGIPASTWARCSPWAGHATACWASGRTSSRRNQECVIMGAPCGETENAARRRVASGDR